MLWQASVLLRPGRYLLTAGVELFDDDQLQIIGDFEDNEDPSDVTVYCTGNARDWSAWPKKLQLSAPF